MKERKNAENAIRATQREALLKLLDVRADVRMAQHHTFGLTRTSAGKDNSRQIIGPAAAAMQSAIEKSCRKQPGNRQSGQPFKQSRLCGSLFEQNGFSRHLDVDPLEKGLRCNHCLDRTLAGT